MSKVEVYSKGYCPYCSKTKATLKKLGVEFIEYEVTYNVELAREMKQRSKRHTVPQIFIDGKHIGGSDEFHAALRKGALPQLQS